MKVISEREYFGNEFQIYTCTARQNILKPSRRFKT